MDKDEPTNGKYQKQLIYLAFVIGLYPYIMMGIVSGNIVYRLISIRSTVKKSSLAVIWTPDIIIY